MAFFRVYPLTQAIILDFFARIMAVPPQTLRRLKRCARIDRLEEPVRMQRLSQVRIAT